MKKISFDWDDTLDNEHIQKYAKELINRDYDVHIVTGRPKIWIKEKWDNSDLYEIANYLNIKKENIHFTDFSPKYKFFEKNEDFIFRHSIIY